MELTTMIEAATSEFKQKIIAQCENLDTTNLTPHLAEAVIQGIKKALQGAGVSALRTFLEAYEVDESPKDVAGVLYRFKQPSEKIFLTPFGQMKLYRNLFQADEGGSSYVPLDVMWGMAGEFATLEVREALLFAAAMITPEETVDLLEKSALFIPSATAIKHIIAETGQWLEEMADAVTQSIHQEADIPKDTKVMAASLDGTTLRLRELGNKRGRPQERPGAKASEETPTSFKQAMVGSLSFYRPSQEKDTPPERLASVYVSQMPEEGWPTLKERFEAELDHTEAHLEGVVKKVLLLDGARNLWKYVDNNPRFAQYEKLVDFYHTTEHLATVAELLFGKKSTQAQSWYDTYYDKLKNEDQTPQSIIRSIDYYKQKRKLGQKRLADLATQRTFFQRNKHRMAYADFRQRGLPIGSGPVEAACKTLVKTRLCRAGMQWSWIGGQRILQLRTYLKSQQWPLLWKAYKTLRLQQTDSADYTQAA